MRFEFTVRIGEDEHDVLVGAPRRVGLHEIWAGLLEVLGSPAHLRPDVDATDVLGSRRLLTGSVIRAGEDASSGTVAAPAVSGLAVHVIGGRDAGRSVPLGPGSVRIGRDPHCGIVLHDERVSRHHASIRADAAGVTLIDHMSTNGTTIEAVPVGSGGARLPIDSVARVGDTLFAVRREDEAALPVVSTGGQQQVAHVPGPALLAPVVLNAAGHPSRPRPRPTQWVAALIPAAAGGGLAWLTHSPTFLLFALLSPLMLLGTALGDRLHLRRTRRSNDAARSVRDAAHQHAVVAALRAETAARRARYPDPVVVGRAASVPAAPLWQRRRADPDLLTLRVGSVGVVSDTRFRRGDTTEAAGRLVAVPLTVDLRDGPIGFAGPPEMLDGLARCLVAQLAVLHPSGVVDLALFLSDRSRDACWSWARWLPHLGDRVARSADAWNALIERLPPPRNDSWIVAVVDRAAASAAGGLADLLGRAGPAGVTGLAFGDAVTDLPSWCVRTVDLWELTSGSETVLDRVSPAWVERVARALAPLTDAVGGTTTLPDRCHLLDVLGLDGPTEDEILARWAASDGRADTALGLTAAGTLRIDLELDGPHVLVAGTTGSGKSELLRTLVLGLALTHPPDELTFVLVDYKGGAAFAECAALPHAVGTVTDLDPHLTGRALRSLEAELRHRERLFAAAGAGDLDGYRRSAGPALARLVIVVDEFAALADTLPDFLHGLISVARRGRSLGVHLVLATQRPGVAVTPEIRANTACRIALRVVEDAESTDVIGVSDAARLPPRRPGRAIMAGDGAPVEFQTAGVDVLARDRVDEVTIERLGEWRQRPAAPVHDAGVPDSARIVAVLHGAADRRGRRPGAGPWLAPLPRQLARDSLGPAVLGRVPLGLIDLPDEQRQDVLDLDLRVPSSWLVVGGSRSGRTTALIGAALAAAEQLSPAELEIYVVDGAGTLVAALSGLPHVATGLGPDELTAAGPLLRGVRDRAPGRAHMLLLIDRGERVLVGDEDGSAPSGAAELTAVLGSRRATVLAAGSRALLAARVSGGFDHRLLLALPDRADYALAGIPVRDVPAAMPPGRAVRVADGVETQFALPSGSRGESRTGTAAAVQVLAVRWGGARSDGAVRVRPLPRMLDLQSLPAHPARLRFGVAGRAADPLHVDPFAGSRRWLIAGPARSGRTTALLTLLSEACRVGVHVLVAAPERSPLHARGTELGVPALDPSSVHALRAPEMPTLVLVDDCEVLAGSPVDDLLAGWVRDSTPLSFVVAGRSDELAAAYRGLAAEVRRARSGVLLRPGPLDGELLDVRLPRSSDGPPGRGVLVGTAGWFVGESPLTADTPVSCQVARP